MKAIRFTTEAVVLAMGMLMMGAVGVRAHAEDHDASLVGTWLFQVSIVNCATGASIGEPFYSLLTFNEGGTMTETTANPMFYPAERGPGHGVWSRAGGRSFKATSVAPNGALQKLQTIAQTIEMTDRVSLKTTSANVRFTAPDGSLLTEGCAAATGRRLELDGLK
jgi:hypothetical protein